MKNFAVMANKAIKSFNTTVLISLRGIINNASFTSGNQDRRNSA